MFSKVIADAQEYTRPVIILFKFANNKKVEPLIGTFIHIDDLGHILSAKHIFTVGSEDPIEAFLCIFDCQYSNAEIIAEDKSNDLVLLKLKDYKPGSIKVFPKFFKSSDKELSKSTPLVRLGYPMGNHFSHVSVIWDETIKSFNWNAANTRLTCVNNHGVCTQYEIDLENNVHFLETNSPALIGQSGGPLLTTQGIVAGLQSKNSVFELSGNRTLEVSIAASHISIARFLEKHSTVQTAWI